MHRTSRGFCRADFLLAVVRTGRPPSFRVPDHSRGTADRALGRRRGGGLFLAYGREQDLPLKGDLLCPLKEV